MQDFFACLMLEQGLAKPVKQELAKELLQLLRGMADKINLTKEDSNSLHSSGSSSSSLDNQTDEIEEIDILKPSVLPEKLQEMSYYLETISGTNEDEQQNTTESAVEVIKQEKQQKAWLTIQDQLFDMRKSLRIAKYSHVLRHFQCSDVSN